MEVVIYLFFCHLLELTLAFVQVQVNLPPAPYIVYKQPAGNLHCWCSVRSYSCHLGMVLGISLAADCPLTHHSTQFPHG